MVWKNKKDFNLVNKAHAIGLAIMTPGIIISWVCLIFPFYLWDSLTDDWYLSFKSDLSAFFNGIAEIWRRK